MHRRAPDELGKPGARRGEFLVHELITALVADPPPPMGEDRRVAFAQDYIANHLADVDSLNRVAGHLGKLRTALECVAKGTSFTTAAATAGFTDSAHFSRTFRCVFGALPSSLLAPGGDYAIMTTNRVGEPAPQTERQRPGRADGAATLSISSAASSLARRDTPLHRRRCHQRVGTDDAHRRHAHWPGAGDPL